MRNLLLSFLLILPAVGHAAEPTPPEQSALKFNQWYIGQLKADKEPLTDFKALSPYVTSDTIKAIKALYSGDSNDKDLPDADMFIKAQDTEDDWSQVSLVVSDFDAVCTNVYIAFGKKKEHVVADCMVRESGVWKVRSVALIKELP